ncbi:MAG: DUF401 family protein [Thermoplasmatota archaeon]
MNELVSLAALLISFSVIIVLVANKKNFGVAMVLGALLLGLLARPERIPNIVYETATDWQVITLVAIVICIKLFATVLQDTGQIPLVIDHLKRVIPQRGMLAIIPFIFGLLPIPGGALLSAPMVDEQGKKLNVDREGRTFLNLWFRHIGFLVFPLSTALVVMSQVSEVSINRLIVVQAPIFLIAVAVGSLYILRLSQKKAAEPAEDRHAAGIIMETAVNILPLIVTIIMAFTLAETVHLNIALLVALPTGILLSLLLYTGDGRPAMLKKGFSPLLGLAIFGIMLYRDMAFASGVTDVVAGYLQGSAASPLLIIPVLSFAIGFLTAHNMAAIPLVYSMVASMIGGDIGLVSLLYVSSFMGYLVSPLHLCVVVSYEYFKPRFVKLYRLMLPPAVLVTAIAVIWLSL